MSTSWILVVASMFIISFLLLLLLRACATFRLQQSFSWNAMLGSKSLNRAHMRRSLFLVEAGLLSFISSMGNKRVILSTEYEMAFKFFDNLREAALAKQWPERDVTDWERITIKKELERKNSTVGDVDRALANFRKVILGVEKYRINNPYRIAQKYSDVINTCIRVPGCWGAAANAVEYAGLNFRDHAIDSQNGTSLALEDLWTKALDRLLDIRARTTQLNDLDSSHNTNEEVWDQRYFSQVEVCPGDIECIQDMLLALMRLACRAVLSRDDRKTVYIPIRADYEESK